LPILLLAWLAGMSPQAIEAQLRTAAAAYYSDVVRVARITSRYSAMDYYYRLRDDADSWADPAASYHRSEEVRNAFAAMSELDLSLAMQLMGRSSQPLGTIRGLGETLVRSSKDGTMQPVAVYVPTQYSPAKPARLVVFLHGRDQPESHLMALPIVSELAERTNTIVVAPYGRAYYDFKGSESDVYDALDAANDAFTLEPEHHYLAGYSMGGFSTFSIAPIRPADWTAVLCVAGALVQQKAHMTTTKMRGIRVYVVTGALDSIVPTQWPQLTASYLRDSGLRVSFYSQPDGTHDLRSLKTAFPSAWDDMENGVVRRDWDLPSGGGLPVGSP
jgi:pimeloyl-ACP methyl ester carboxylesterase